MERRPPAFQFFAEDFLTGVMAMTDAERGVYITLLALSWSRGGPLTDSTERLAMACSSLPEVVQGVLDLKFTNDGGGWRNNRLEKTRLEQAEYHEKRVKTGQMGATKRWDRSPIADLSLTNGEPTSDPIANHSPSSSSSSSSSKKKIETSDQICFAAARRAEAICKDIGRPRSGDRILAWQAAVLVSAGVYSEHWLCDSVEAVKQGDRKKNPWGYFTTSLRNKAKEIGRDFDADRKTVPTRKAN